MEGEGEWMTGAASPVIHAVSFKQLNQIAEKRSTKWYSEEDVGTIGDQDRAISGVRNPIRSYVRAAERRLSPRFLRQSTKNYCAWSVSANEILPERSPTLLKTLFSKARDVMSNRFHGKKCVGKRSTRLASLPG